MTSPNFVYDVIVIGAGIEGSAIAYNLRKEGQTVLLLEQFPLPHTRGSSHGQSRITRYAYEDEFYVRMMVDAFPLWAELEKEAGTQFFINCGVLDIRTDDSPGLRRVQDALRAHHIPHERLSSGELQSRYPMINVKDHDAAIWDPSGGLLNANRALWAFQETFKHLGGILHDSEPVTSVVPGPEVIITTTRSRYRSRQVVLAAGPWSGTLCSSIGLHLPLTTKRIPVFYWKTSPEYTQLYGAKSFPCFIDTRWKGSTFHSYGLPIAEYPGLVKVCPHDGSRIHPDERDRGASDTWSEAAVVNFVSSTFTGLETTPSIKEYCIYTETPDNHAFIDRHPKYFNVVIAAGFSGHGFKLAPAVGKAVTDLVLKRRPTYNMEPFKIDRFTPKSHI